MGSEGETSLSRTLTMNLIAVIGSADEERIREARDRLLTRHPCRAFGVVLDEEQGEISTGVSVETRLLRSCRQMVLEQVTLRAHPRDFSVLPGVIRPLLVSDLPVHQYWGMELPEDVDLLAVLGEMAEQTTVDSSLFSDPARDLENLESCRKELRIVDLTWYRLRPWRRGLAEAFEHFTWTSDAPTEVSIRHAPVPGATAASLCLGHWLREKLEARVRLVPDSEGDACPEPHQVDLRQGDTHVCVSRQGMRLVAAVSLADRCLLPFEVVASRGQPGDLLAAAVDLH